MAPLHWDMRNMMIINYSNIKKCSKERRERKKRADHRNAVRVAVMLSNRNQSWSFVNWFFFSHSLARFGELLPPHHVSFIRTLLWKEFLTLHPPLYALFMIVSLKLCNIIDLYVKLNLHSPLGPRHSFLIFQNKARERES